MISERLGEMCECDSADTCGEKFLLVSYGSETSDMTSEGLGEMFEGDSTDMCAGKFPLVLMRD